MNYTIVLFSNTSKMPIAKIHFHSRVKFRSKDTKIFRRTNSVDHSLEKREFQSHSKKNRENNS